MLKDQSKYPRLSISRLRKTMAQSLDRAFARHGHSVTNEQELVLRSLRNNDAISQTELAALTGQDRNNLSRTVGILEKKGLVVKRSCEVDRRYCTISITEEGEKIHDELWEILEKWRGEFFKGIALEDLMKFKEISEKLICNLSDSPSPACPRMANQTRRNI